MTGDSSWLCRDHLDRERMLDMEVRLRPIRTAAFAPLAIGLLVSGPWLGFWTLIPLAIAGAAFRVVDRLMPRVDRPEYLMFAAWVASEVIIAFSTAITGGPTVPTVAWLALPVATLGHRFRLGGILAGVLVALALLFAVELLVDPGAVADDPPLLVAPAALIVSVGIFSIAGMRSDVQHRRQAFTDSLTGCLNRAALATRLDELAQQSAVLHRPIGVIACDIDHFKAVNDEFGHAAGDAVLVDVAYLLRKCVRAFDSVYRTGGEEFLVVLPGAGLERSLQVADAIRFAVNGATHGPGRSITMSFGVYASEPETPFNAEIALAEADGLLYTAKRHGRNRIESRVSTPVAA